MGWTNDKGFFINILLWSFVMLLVQGGEIKEENETCPVRIYGQGEFFVPSQNECNHYILKSLEKTSIFRIEVELPESNSTNATQQEENKLRVDFIEYRKENGSDVPVTVMTWWISDRMNTSKLEHLSRDPLVEIDITGGWVASKLKFTYQEIQLDGDTRSSNDLKGEIRPWVMAKGGGYQPNHALLFQIRKSPLMNESSIGLTLKSLDIDEGVGEYLLIGAGLKPFDGPRPLFVSQSFSGPNPKKYIINDENAYILFVSGAARQRHTGFRIAWEQRGSRIAVDEKVKDDTITEDVLNSIQICIYNLTAAKIELSTLNSPDWFKDFRSTFARISNDYAEEESIQLHSNITTRKVDLFRVSAVIPVDEDHPDLEDGALSVMLRIKGSDKGWAVFSRDQLLAIFQRYTQCCMNATQDYKVNICPLRSPVPRQWGKVLLYCLVPISCCLFLIIWTWKKNPLHEYLNVKNLKSVYKNAKMDDASNENVYVSVPNGKPKIYLTTDHGRRNTLFDEDSEVEIFNKEDIQKMTRMRQMAAMERGSLRSSTRSQDSGGIVNEAFESTDYGALEDNATHRRKMENVYDSLKSKRYERHVNPCTDENEFTKF